MSTVVSKHPHTVNGKFYGWWVQFDTGMVYFAYRKGAGSKGYFRAADAWCIDLTTLNDAKYRGVKFVGVIHEHKKRRDLYITPIDDLFGKLSEAHIGGTTRQRRLGRRLWLISPLKREEYISKAVKIR